ncbi:hypothetical protein MJO28_013073 [Puccinia striiformis f. sp. tritici]|uniref:Uncharacterized protein n=4 Tax=Puccinia striiformis TaxID=27350 RepID=A0A0L0UYE7_9BASI|nr:hypothetical protein Pst134EB_025137 [Puccinia striiformis f. sp. tritici]KAI7940788.1 hypothetical protein MJO28_013073 [Puccinia striiformis f. sp. tritici]KNE92072.1 hypothetical protein PSTG_14547 [Puccinia striiformis f. sp. tritici PST-78]POV98197.1 hypothetical protein PSHT_14134 [Puccinia striiformis]POW06146.1 hypothetical protein PSTT_09237 [Puccinia striiformis]
MKVTSCSLTIKSHNPEFVDVKLTSPTLRAVTLEQFLAELKQLYTTALETEGNRDTQALKALLELTIEQEQYLITQKQKLTVLKQKFTVRKQKITEQQQINTCVWTLGLTLQGGQS